MYELWIAWMKISKLNLVTMIMKLAIIRNLIAKLAHQTVSKAMQQVVPVVFGLHDMK
jgi:hypothetical protein